MYKKLYQTYISKGYNFVHHYICDFKYPLSYEPILPYYYTLIYMSLFQTLYFFLFGWQNMGAGHPHNRPRTESPGHNRLNKVGDCVFISDDYIQRCYVFSVLFSCDYEFCYNTNIYFGISNM